MSRTTPFDRRDLVRRVNKNEWPAYYGKHVYRFLATGPGQTTAVMEYARSFEPDQPPARTHTVSVTVR